MKLNIERFAGDAFTISVKVLDYKYNGKGEMMSCKVRIESNYNIDSIYDIDDLGSENWAYSYWDQHRSENVPNYSSDAPYIERVFTSLDDISGVHIQTYDINSGNNKYISYLFNIVEQENASTTYLTKTSATAVLKGNVLNSLNTYDYNNAPSVAAVRNYLDSGSFVHQSDVESMVSQAVSNALLAVHPVGSIEINITGTNPSEYLGGEWESFGTGKTLIGVDSSQTEFNTVEKTGGSKTHSHNYGLKAGGYYNDTVLTESTQDGVFTWDSNNNRTLMNLNSSIGSQSVNINGGNATSKKSANMAHYQAIANTSYVSTLQPYITVYFWKRIY